MTRHERILELERQHLAIGAELAREAEQLIAECKEHEWVWCDYKVLYSSSLSPAQKCKICRREIHTWEGNYNPKPGKVDREDLYKMRYSIHVEGEIPRVQ